VGWNDSNNNGQKNPWGAKNNAPPDLDEALKRLHAKFKKLLGGSAKKPSMNLPEGSESIGFLATIVCLVLFVLWILSGIYIVGPAEQAAVLRFGRYIETVGPGPHWIPRFFESKIVKNVDQVLDYSYSAQMLTKDENLVAVALAVQYRIGDLENYLFNVAKPGESLQQATSSALRQVVGATTLDQIITEGREAWGASVHEALVQILSRYKTGIVIVNVSPQPARAPESVQDAFDDAIKAQEDEKRFKEQARAYQASVVPIAQGNAKRIIEAANARAQELTLRAMGETAEFLAILPEYVKAPVVTGERIYFDTMQRVLERSSKVFVSAASGNIFYLPLDKFMSSESNATGLGALNSPILATSSSIGTTYDGRDVVRSTQRVGRSH